MLLQYAISFTTLSIFALTVPHTASAAPGAIVHDLKVSAITVSTRLHAAFNGEDKPEPVFFLDKAPSKISHWANSFKKRATGCASYYKVSSDDTCLSVVKKNGISIAAFMKLNREINSGCTNLNVNKKYCIEASITSSCAKTHKVTRTDTCTIIAKKYRILISDFYKWNSRVDKDSCSNLRRGKFYCVAQDASVVTSSSITTGTAAVAASPNRKSTTAQASAFLGTVSTKVTDLVVGTRTKIQTDSAFTYYWIAHNEDYMGGPKVTIKTCSGATIGKVNENYADALVMEGTGVIGDNIINLGSCSCSNYRCFEILDRSKEPYGITAYGTALQPYVSIAANDIPKNTKIYVPALDGWKMPKSDKTHNGCLLVDDQSWSFESKHIDFYVYEMGNYKSLDRFHPITKVDIYEGGNCKLLSYI